MTQRSAQERLSKIGMIGVLALASLFVGIALHSRRSSPPPPAKVELPKEPPDLLLLVTANRQGKLEVCGCPGKRAEDLAKVASLIQETVNEMERKGVTVSVIEGGDFTGSADVVPYLLRAYRAVGYQCIVLSPRDEKLLSVIRTNADGVQLLTSANSENLQTFRIEGRNFSVVLVNLGQPLTKNESYWQRVLPKLKTLKHPKTLLAVVAHISHKESADLISRLVGVADILLIDDRLASSFDDAILLANGEAFANKVGKEIFGVFVASLPQSRSSVLSLLVWANSGKDKGFRFDARWLQATNFSDHRQVKKIVDEYYEVRRRQLEQEMKQIMKIASQRAYLPPEYCGKCHQAQYEQWLSTDHARAIETLAKQKRMDKDCLVCHSLEFRLRGVVTKQKGRGVECVDCHTELQDPATAQMHGQRPGERPTTKIVNEATCTSCHNKEHSPEFNLQTYLPKVSH